ncbi:MAG: ubiquitin-activating E1 FCCH domain-containing protein [Opitutales bacterium]
MPNVLSIGMKVAGFFKAAGTTATVIATIVNTTVIAGAMGVFNKKAKFGKVAGTKRELQGRTLNARGSIGSRQYIYGKVKVGGQVAYMETVGDENRFLHMVLVHCAHEVDEIGDLYVNDELVPLSGTTPESGNKYNGHLVVHSYTGRSDQVASPELVSIMSNWTNAHRLRGCAYSYLILELDREDNVWPGGIPTFTRVIKGRKSWDPRPLSITAINQSAAAQVTVVGHGLVTGDHILATGIGGMTELNGTEYYVNRLTDDTFGLYDATTLAAINSTGFTAYTSGGTITRKRYSANAAICIADYITSEFGFGRFGTDRNDIDSSDWISAANVCDDPITLNTNPWVASTYVSKGAYRNNDLSPVKTYRATNSGTSAGSGGPTGTGSSITDTEITWEYVQTATTTEPRYEINGTIQANEDPQAVLKKLKGAMAGFVEYIGGNWIIHAGSYRTATTTLTEADFASGIAGSTKDDRRSSANRVKGIFADANDKYATVDFPAVTNSTYLTEDKGVEAWRDVEYAYTTSSSTAQRLAKINLERGRQQIKHTASFSLKAMRIQAGDNFKLTFAKYSYSAKEFVCLSHKLFMGDGGSLAVEMTFRETASTIFAWSNGEETVLDPAPNTNLPNPFSVATPTIGTIESGTDQLVSQGGIVRSRIMVPWTAGDDAHLSGHEVQWKRRNAYTITGVSKSNPCVVTFASHNFENGETVDFYQLGGMTQLNGNSYTVANKTATTIELSGINSTSFGTWTSGGFAESTWDAAITVPMPSTVFYISDVEDGVDYDVRVRGITSVAKSSYNTVTNHTVVGKTAAPANPVSPTVSAVENGVSVQFNQHADLDFLQYQIWVQISSSAPTHTGTGAFTPAATTTTSDLSKTITGLDPDLTYYVFTAAQDSTRLLSNIVATSPATISPLAISADSSLGTLATLDRVNLATTSNGGVTGSLPVGNTDATNNGATVNSSGNVNGGMVVNATSGAIQSSNYNGTSGSETGWKIDGDGNADFYGDVKIGTDNLLSVVNDIVTTTSSDHREWEGEAGAVARGIFTQHDDGTPTGFGSMVVRNVSGAQNCNKFVWDLAKGSDFDNLVGSPSFNACIGQFETNVYNGGSTTPWSNGPYFSAFCKPTTANSNTISGGWDFYSNPLTSAGKMGISDDLFYTSNVDVSHSGSVGIGTTAPAHKLSVFGDSNGNRTEIGIDNIDQRLVLGAYFETGVAQYSTIQSTNNAESTATNLVLQPDGGNVGIGTNPSNTLHVKNLTSSGAYIQYDGKSNNEFGLKVESNVSGGNFEGDFLSGGTLLDLFANSGTTSGGDVLVCRTRSANPLFIVKGNGHVFQNCTPAAIPGITNTTDHGLMLEADGSDGTSLHVARKDNAAGNFARQGTGDVLIFRNTNGSVTEAGSIEITGAASVAFRTSSDYRLKENLVDISDAIGRVKQLNPVRFNFIGENSIVDGFLAHEVQEIVPEAIGGNKDAMKDEEYEVSPAVHDDDGEVATPQVMATRSVPDYQGIDQSKLVPLLTAALQEALSKIDALEARVQTLEGFSS